MSRTRRYNRGRPRPGAFGEHRITRGWSSPRAAPRRASEPLKFWTVGASAQGGGRLRNEDSFHASSALIAVADGTSAGRPDRNGSVASRTAIETVVAAVPFQEPDEVRAAVRRADRAIAALGESSGGTTLTVLAIVSELDGWLGLAHAGDSRAYRMRAGVLEQLTDDHNMAARREREGETLSELDLLRARRLVYNNLAKGSAVIESRLLRVECGDRFIVCSDGLTAVLSDEAICRACGEFGDDVAGGLVDLAVDAGARDDVTVVVAEIVDAELES